MFPVYFFSAAIVVALAELFISKKPKTQERILEVFLRNIILFSIGLQGVFAFMGHAFMADKVAEQIGWPTGSPFQFEIAVANLAMGLAGIACAFIKNKYYWLAVVQIAAVFIFGAAYGHFVQHAKGDNSPYNWGIFLFFGDIFVPAVYTLLMGYSYAKFMHSNQAT